MGVEATRKRGAIMQRNNLTMKAAFLILAAIMLSAVGFCQDYTSWSEHEVKRFYTKLDVSDAIDMEGEEIEEVFVPVSPKAGTYNAEVTKVSSKVYGIRGTDFFMLFRYSPYLSTYDEGVVVVDAYGSGTFYEKP